MHILHIYLFTFSAVFVPSKVNYEDLNVSLAFIFAPTIHCEHFKLKAKAKESFIF